MVDFEDLDKDWKKAVKKVLKEEGFKVDDINNIYETTFDHGFEVDAGWSFMIFLNDEDAEYEAQDRVREDLREEPSMFVQSWLQSYVFVGDTDRRIMAGEQADFRSQDMSVEDMAQEIDMDGELDELQEEVESLPDEIVDLEDELDTNETKIAKSKRGTDRYENLADEIFGVKEDITQKEKDLQDREKELETLEDTIRDDFHDRIYDETYDGLDDPIEYFVHEQGLYSIEELMKQNFISIDVDEASKDAVNVDGVAHFLSGYDGEEREVEGIYYYRTN